MHAAHFCRSDREPGGSPCTGQLLGSDVQDAAGNELLQAPAATAGAARPIERDDHVAEVAGRAVSRYQPPARDDGATDPGPHGKQDVRAAPKLARLSDSRSLGVVDDEYWQASLAPQAVGEIERLADPDIRRRLDPPVADDARDTHAKRGWLQAEVRSERDHLRTHEIALVGQSSGPRPAGLADQLPVRRGQGDPDPGPSPVHRGNHQLAARAGCRNRQRLSRTRHLSIHRPIPGGMG